MTPVIIIRLVGRSMRNQAVSIPDMGSLCFFLGIKKSSIMNNRRILSQWITRNFAELAAAPRGRRVVLSTIRP